MQPELVGFFRPDQAIKTVRNTNDLPLVLQNGGFDRGANDGVGNITKRRSPRQCTFTLFTLCTIRPLGDANAARFAYCTVMVTALLVIPLRLAVTVVVELDVALELTVPLTLP